MTARARLPWKYCLSQGCCEACMSAIDPAAMILPFPKTAMRSQAHHADLGHHELVEQPLRDLKIFAHRKLDVLAHRERGEQRALLKQDPPAALDAAALRGTRRIQIDAENLDTAGNLRHEADDG